MPIEDARPLFCPKGEKGRGDKRLVDGYHHEKTGCRKWKTQNKIMKCFRVNVGKGRDGDDKYGGWKGSRI